MSQAASFYFAVGIFAVGFALIMTERINRAIVALLGAGLLIVGGVMTQAEAINSIDFNTLGLLAGMMVIVHITSKTGVFQYLAIWAAKRVKADAWGLLLMISIITALISSLLDNVTTVLLITPVLLSICKELKVPVFPYLFSCIFASNIGGTATLIGDPPNIMIGSAVGYNFNDFVVNLGPIIAVVLGATIAMIYLIWGRKLHAASEDRTRVMQMNLHATIKDHRLLRHSLIICAGVIAAFIFAHQLHLEPATIAMGGAALLLLLENLAHDRKHHAHNVHAAFAEAEWVTLFFFIGLFIMVHGIEKVGFITMLGESILRITHGDLALTTYAVLWVSAIASAVLDNIPYTATMIPLIKSLAPSVGGDANLAPLWWALSLGACLGGNGTLVGASANLVVAGLAERAGHPIRFLPYLKYAFPLMLVGIFLSHAYLYFFYLS